MPLPQPLFPNQLAVPANGLCEAPDGQIWCTCSTNDYTEPNGGPTDLIVTPKRPFNPTDYPVTYPSGVDALFITQFGRSTLLPYEGSLWFVAAALVEPGSESLPVVAQIDPTTGAVSNWYIGSGSPAEATSEVTNLCVGPDGNMWFLSNGIYPFVMITTGGAFSYFPLTLASGPFLNTNLISGPDYLYCLCFDDITLVPTLVQLATDGTQTVIATLPSEFSDGPQCSSMLFGPDGNIWIAWFKPAFDGTNYWGIYVYDTSGTLLDTFGFTVSPAFAASGFLPKDMTTDGVNVYACGWWFFGGTYSGAASVTSSVFQITTAGAFTEQDLLLVPSTSRPSGIICHSVDKTIWISDWWGPNPWGKLWGPPNSGWHVGSIALQ